MAVPSLIYSTEIWILTKKQQQRIEVVDTEVLRNKAGYALKGQIINTTR
jgi:hypothetical protein